jgi:hypothetical protein
MHYAFEPEASGSGLVQFVDVPEAHTSGATEPAAAEQALDCLIAALGGYIKLARKIPRPSPARGRPVATLPPVVTAKLALYEAMRAQGITCPCSRCWRRWHRSMRSCRRSLNSTSIRSSFDRAIPTRCGWRGLRRK